MLRRDRCPCGGVVAGSGLGALLACAAVITAAAVGHIWGVEKLSARPL